MYRRVKINNLYIKSDKEKIFHIKKYLKIIIIISIGIIYLIYILQNLSYSKEIEIYFTYVGQGNATVIKLKNNKNIVIDSGEGLSNRYETGYKIFLPYLLRNKIKDIEHLYITHFDKDHVGGSYYLIKYLNVKNIYFPFQLDEKIYSSKIYREIIKISTQRKVKIHYLKQGDNMYLEQNVSVKILWPNKLYKKKINAANTLELIKNSQNNNSLVLMFNIYKYKVLFTGDIEKEVENILVKQNINLSADILLVPHHGSNTSSTSEFIEKIKPKTSIISCGYKNMFKHPKKETLDVLNKFNSKIYVLSITGEVKVKITNNAINYIEFKNTTY